MTDQPPTIQVSRDAYDAAQELIATRRHDYMEGFLWAESKGTDCYQSGDWDGVELWTAVAEFCNLMAIHPDATVEIMPKGFTPPKP